jgi:hypothetical protein
MSNPYGSTPGTDINTSVPSQASGPTMAGSHTSASRNYQIIYRRRRLRVQTRRYLDQLTSFNHL